VFFKHDRWRDDCELRFMVRYRAGIMHGPRGIYGNSWPRGEYRPVDLNRFITRITIGRNRDADISTSFDLSSKKNAVRTSPWSGPNCRGGIAIWPSSWCATALDCARSSLSDGES
jgi:hypothetical protein